MFTQVHSPSPSSLQPHTILLIQPARGHETRTYTDYETLQECLEGTRRDSSH